MQRRGSRFMTCAVLAAVAVFVALPRFARAEEAPTHTRILKETAQAFSYLSKQAIPAVVFIQVEKEARGPDAEGQPYFFNDPSELFGDEFLRRFFGDRMPDRRAPRERSPRRQAPRFREMGQGTGFLISKDGYILTNNHVVGDADKITVRLHDGREFEARRVGADEKSEVAVIKIEDGNREFPFLEMGDAEALEIGEWVVAIGNPFGLSETVTAGIVSAKGRSNVGIADYENFIQTDAAINPGNSGGPLLNIEGKVVGVNTAIYSRSGGYMGIGFAIPINMALAIKDQLIKTGRVTRGFLGIHIQPLTRELAESFGLDEAKGILVSDVEEDSAAGKAGVRQGDVILELDGAPVESVGAFRNRIASQPPGTKVELGIVRDGKRQTLSAVTGTLPGEESAKAGDEGASDVDEQFGMSLHDLTPELAERAGYKDAEGVFVESVEPGSKAWRAGIRAGSLVVSADRKPVKTVGELRKILSHAAKGSVILLRVREGDGTMFVTLRKE